MISVEALTFRYPGTERDILRHLSLTITEATWTALMGANGSGKSTLARCLDGLLRPTGGRVVVDGMDTTHADTLPLIRRKVGLVFQDPHLQMTSPTIERELAFGLQNVGVTTEEVHRRVNQALDRFRWHHRRHESPASLSGGEKQRLALAAVMLLQPKYLVLDEPTAFLSPQSQRLVLDDLERIARDERVGVVFITESLTEAMRAERVIVLDGGEVIFDDTPQKLALNETVMHRAGVVRPRTFETRYDV
ncbi:MAG: energy-coupling factor transporter ATPase [Ignavibacteria bacterium]